MMFPLHGPAQASECNVNFSARKAGPLCRSGASRSDVSLLTVSFQILCSPHSSVLSNNFVLANAFSTQLRLFRSWFCFLYTAPTETQCFSIQTTKIQCWTQISTDLRKYFEWKQCNIALHGVAHVDAIDAFLFFVAWTHMEHIATRWWRPAPSVVQKVWQSFSADNSGVSQNGAYLFEKMKGKWHNYDDCGGFWAPFLDIPIVFC